MVKILEGFQTEVINDIQKLKNIPQHYEFLNNNIVEIADCVLIRDKDGIFVLKNSQNIDSGEFISISKNDICSYGKEKKEKTLKFLTLRNNIYSQNKKLNIICEF